MQLGRCLPKELRDIVCSNAGQPEVERGRAASGWGPSETICFSEEELLVFLDRWFEIGIDHYWLHCYQEKSVACG